MLSVTKAANVYMNHCRRKCGFVPIENITAQVTLQLRTVLSQHGPRHCNGFTYLGGDGEDNEIALPKGNKCLLSSQHVLGPFSCIFSPNLQLCELRKLQSFVLE